MPKAKRSKTAHPAMQESGFESPMGSSSNDEDRVLGPSKRKRSAVDDEEDEFDFAFDIKKMFENFQKDLAKNMTNKQRRMDNFSKASGDVAVKKVEDVLKIQKSERKQLVAEFNKQLDGVLTQWDSDLSRCKEQEEKLQNLFQQQAKYFQQTRSVLQQRLKSVKGLHDQLKTGLSNLDECHAKQVVGVKTDIRKEIALLQKKLLMDTQQQEVQHFRRSLMQDQFF